MKKSSLITATLMIAIASSSAFAMNGQADRINEERFAPQKKSQVIENESALAMNGQADRINEERFAPQKKSQVIETERALA
jgi:ferredoxin-NADP reductase